MRRPNLFLRAALLLPLLTGIASFRLHAQINPPQGTQAGQELAASLRAMRPDRAVEWTGTLQIYGRGHKTGAVPISFQSSLTESNWSFTYETRATDTQGAEKLTIIFSTNAPNQYLYAQAPSPGAVLGEPKVLTGDAANIPLGGSDFWLSDLGFEFYHWPQQERMKGEQKRGRACYVVESRNPAPANGYSRVTTWVDEKTDQPLQADAYGADHRQLKHFEVGSVENVSGHWEAKGLKMFNYKTGSRTQLDFDLRDK